MSSFKLNKLHVRQCQAQIEINQDVREDPELDKKCGGGWVIGPNQYKPYLRWSQGPLLMVSNPNQYLVDPDPELHKHFSGLSI